MDGAHGSQPARRVAACWPSQPRRDPPISYAQTQSILAARRKDFCKERRANRQNHLHLHATMGSGPYSSVLFNARGQQASCACQRGPYRALDGAFISDSHASWRGASVAGSHPALNGDGLAGETGGAAIVLEGRITAYTAAPVWRKARDTLARQASVPT